MNTAPIILSLGRSTSTALCLERDGERVELDEAFSGFFITRDDANAILTMAARFVQARDEFQK